MERLGFIVHDKGIKTPVDSCGDPDCKNKVVLIIKMKNIMFPVCREHLEKLYNGNFFDETKNIDYLKMVEGIIKYGSFEAYSSQNLNGSTKKE